MFDGIIDLSHNNTISLRDARQNGIAAVIHKATQGITFTDPMYAPRRAQAQKLGLLWGAYHFGTSDNVPQQVTCFLDAAQLGPHDVAALDFETNPSGGSMTLAEAEMFVELFHAHTGSWPMIYGSALLPQITSGSPLVQCPLWIAQYTTEAQPSLPPAFSAYVLWQFTDGTHPSPSPTAGVAVDRDCYNGTLQQLQSAWPFR